MAKMKEKESRKEKIREGEIKKPKLGKRRY